MENDLNSFINKKLSHSAMKELLPDYAFNKLSDNEKIIFEKNISNFPDLEDELVEISNVFARVDKYDYKNMISERSKNLSVKVHIKQSKKNTSTFGYIWKYGMPTAVILIFAYFIGNYFNFEFAFSPKSESISATNKQIIKPSEAKALLSDLTNEELNDKTEIDNVAYQSQSHNDIEAEKLIAEFLNSDYNLFSEKYNNDYMNEFDISSNPNVMINDLKDFSEEDFQLLLESMEDVEIES